METHYQRDQGVVVVVVVVVLGFWGGGVTGNQDVFVAPSMNRTRAWAGYTVVH